MIQSPCINICKLDAKSEFCVGCFRTLAEISVWSRTDDAQRRRILNEVERRRSEVVVSENNSQQTG